MLGKPRKRLSGAVVGGKKITPTGTNSNGSTHRGVGKKKKRETKEKELPGGRQTHMRKRLQAGYRNQANHDSEWMARQSRTRRPWF